MHSIRHATIYGLAVSIGAGCAAPHINIDPVYFPKASDRPRVVHLISFNSLADIAPVEPSWMDALSGSSYAALVHTPSGMDFRDHCLYIADTGLKVIHQWNLQTGQARTLGATGENRLMKPVDVAVDSAGQVFAADTLRGDVVMFDAQGNGVARLRPPDAENYQPVAVSVIENRIAVADIARHRIDFFSPQDGALEASLGGPGRGDGEFYYPMGLACGRSHELYVSDMMNGRVQVFDGDLSFLRAFGQSGDRYGDFGKTHGIGVSDSGHVFVADSDFRHVHVFDTSGELLMLFGGPGGSPGDTPFPSGVAVAESLPDRLTQAVPDDFAAEYFVFISNSMGRRRISLFAVGVRRPHSHNGAHAQAQTN